MAYDTFTLNIRDRSFDDRASSYVRYKIWPLANNDGKKLGIIRDTQGNKVLGGHAEDTINGASNTALVAVANLPDPRDDTLDPDGFGFKVWVKTQYWEREAFFGSAELDLYLTDGVLELEDVTDTDPAAFSASVSYAEQGDLEAEALSRSQADDALTTALGTKANASSLGAETTRATNAETALRTGTDTTFETRLSSAFAARWQAAHAYLANDLALAPDGTIIQRIANGTSRASYDATEAALWTVKTSSGGGGGLTVTDNGDGTGIFTPSGTTTVTDNGDGTGTIAA